MAYVRKRKLIKFGHPIKQSAYLQTIMKITQMELFLFLFISFYQLFDVVACLFNR